MTTTKQLNHGGYGGHGGHEGAKVMALSVRQPWAWLIVNGYKPVENRNWPTHFRGHVLIHASKGMTLEEYQAARGMALRIDPTIPFPAFDKLERGGFVGCADVTDCVESSDSPWFVGEYGFVVANAAPMPFTPYRGQLNFFEVKQP